jgi:hypothetical protein
MQWALGDKNSLAWLPEKLVCVNRRFEVVFQNVYMVNQKIESVADIGW